MRSSREYGLPPILGKDPAVLVLGSFPSKKSLETQQYYANPHNQFWRIMSDLLIPCCMKNIPSFYEVLKDHHIAVWDIIGSRSFQRGSMDRDITDPEFNDIPGLIRSHPTIRFIGTNGGKSWEFFQRSLRSSPLEEHIVMERLPSTSPAYAACSYEKKLLRWHVLLEHI
ncbi:MAG: DNA-deoxyinosine glycosylase [Methanoregulaceae archaeon]|jgi:TDG/mug DNA glycosylase family protein|nr:DNA-deoxyinosine glycosylase [Methanoregulaceae archaeon]